MNPARLNKVMQSISNIYLYVFPYVCNGAGSMSGRRMDVNVGVSMLMLFHKCLHRSQARVMAVAYETYHMSRANTRILWKAFISFKTQVPCAALVQYVQQPFHAQKKVHAGWHLSVSSSNPWSIKIRCFKLH